MAYAPCALIPEPAPRDRASGSHHRSRCRRARRGGPSDGSAALERARRLQQLRGKPSALLLIEISPVDRWSAGLISCNSVAFCDGKGTHHSSLHKGFRGISSLRLRYSTVPCAFTPGAVFLTSPKGNGRYERGQVATVDTKQIQTTQVGEYEVPVNPMDELECDSCQ